MGRGRISMVLSQSSSVRRRSKMSWRTTSPKRCRLPPATGSVPRLLEAKRYTDAERVYREELADHPHNGWSLIGLQKALAGQARLHVTLMTT